MGRMLGAFDNPQELDRPDLNKCPDCECFFAQDTCPLCGKVCPEEMRAGNRKKPKKAKRVDPYANRVRFISWYHTWAFIILMIVINPLIGAILLFTSPHSKKQKILVVAIYLAALVFFVVVVPLITMAINIIMLKSLVNGESPYSDLPQAQYMEICDNVSAKELFIDGKNYDGKPITVRLKVIDVYPLNGETMLWCEDPSNPSYCFLVRDCTDGGSGASVGDTVEIYGDFYSADTVSINGVGINFINMYYCLSDEISLSLLYTAA